MGMLQTLMALVVLIYVLSVMVQGIQEIIKSRLKLKAGTIASNIDKFMGDHLTLSQVQGALKIRGLDIAALEHFSQEDFRHLLDGVELTDSQIKGIVASASVTAEQAKNNIAGAYEAARASFQKEYTAKNKLFAVFISFAVVLALNASLITIYEILAANQNMSQAIVSASSKTTSASQSGQNGDGGAKPADLDAYMTATASNLQKYPILLRTCKYPSDFKADPFKEIAGLILMGLLVSLGAPFWNDVLKGMTGANNALNSGAKKT